MISELKFLKKKVERLEREVKHWKNNHADVTEKKRKLHQMYDTLLRQTNPKTNNYIDYEI